MDSLLSVAILTLSMKGRKVMKRKKVFVAVMGGVLSMGLVGASAATLGTLSGAGLGADDQVVAGCDTDGITVGYTTAYSAAAQTYQVTAVNFTAVNAACNGKAASVSLRNGTTNLGTTNVASITVAASAFSVTLGSAVTASSVNGLSLVISG
ncbi:MAG: hypothetical protein ACXV5U_10280 [Ilumatobacteraceae bacterium]